MATGLEHECSGFHIDRVKCAVAVKRKHGNLWDIFLSISCVSPFLEESSTAPSKK